MSSSMSSATTAASKNNNKLPPIVMLAETIPPSCVGDAVSMIRIRRDNLRPHLDAEIEWWIQAYTFNNTNTIPDYQMAAWCMAVCFHPLSSREIATLTRCMVQSGRSLDWSSFLSSSSSSPSSSSSNNSISVLVDKHSTGGVGDKVTIILAPLVACLGVKVPSIAGRGLGHTGGTIDKLESIPGFNTALSWNEFQRIVAGDDNNKTTGGGVGCCIISAGPDLCPADRKLYSLRDVTCTVRSIGLQTASIMCKKIAERPHSIVLDCKYGLGAFQPTVDEAAVLAESMIATGLANGLHPSSTAFLTCMDQPLGSAVGNWLEILECIQIMAGKLLPLPLKTPPVQISSSSSSTSSSSTLPIVASIETSADLITLVCIQAGQMLLQSGLYPNQSLDVLTVLALDTLMEGKALTKFIDMCRMQGGDVSVIHNAIAATKIAISSTTTRKEQQEEAGNSSNVNDSSSSSSPSSLQLLPPHVAPSHRYVIRAASSGVVTEINAMTIGLLAVDLGAGRKTEQDELHHGTGFWFHVKVGHVVQENDVLVQVFSDVPLLKDKEDDDNDNNNGFATTSTATTTSLLQRVKECIIIAQNENDADTTFGQELVQQPIVTHRVTSQDGMQAVGPLPAKLKQFLYGSS